MRVVARRYAFEDRAVAELGDLGCFEDRVVELGEPLKIRDAPAMLGGAHTVDEKSGRAFGDDGMETAVDLTGREWSMRCSAATEKNNNTQCYGSHHAA